MFIVTELIITSLSLQVKFYRWGLHSNNGYCFLQAVGVCQLCIFTSSTCPHPTTCVTMCCHLSLDLSCCHHIRIISHFPGLAATHLGRVIYPPYCKDDYSNNNSSCAGNPLCLTLCTLPCDPPINMWDGHSLSKKKWNIIFRELSHLSKVKEPILEQAMILIKP